MRSHNQTVAARLSSAGVVSGGNCGAVVAGVVAVGAAAVVVEDVDDVLLVEVEVSAAGTWMLLPGPGAGAPPVVDDVAGLDTELVDDVDDLTLDFLADGSAAHDTCTTLITGRNRSSAVLPTRSRALLRSLTPGRSTTICEPSRFTSVSATPKPLTRLRMMSTALSSTSLPRLGPTGASRTSIPPWRSRPSTGEFPLTIVAAKVPQITTTVTMRYQKLRRT